MEASFYHAKTKYPGIFGWLFTTDHKRIGLLYLFSTLSFFFVGVLPRSHHASRTHPLGHALLQRPDL